MGPMVQRFTIQPCHEYAIVMPGNSSYGARVRWLSVCIALLLAAAISAEAGSAKVLKVLPHLLDKKGRDSVNPSLYDRDAYQVELRDNPSMRAALRFDVNWKARGYDDLTLRIEARGGQPRQQKVLVLDQKVHPRFLSTWSKAIISGEDYQKFGELIAWRATLWNGTNVVAEQKSFLW